MSALTTITCDACGRKFNTDTRRVFDFPGKDFCVGCGVWMHNFYLSLHRFFIKSAQNKNDDQFNIRSSDSEKVRREKIAKFFMQDYKEEP